MTIKSRQIKIGLIAFAGILVIGIMSTTNLEDAIGAMQTVDIEPDDVISPIDLPRTGTPFLVAYPIAIHPANYHEINVNGNSWISKVTKYGEISVSEQELKDYFAFIQDKNHAFGVNVNGTTKFYEIEFREVPLSPDLFYVKAYKLPPLASDFKQIDTKNQPWLQRIADNEYRWIEIDESSALSLKQLTSDDDFNFRIVKVDGSSDIYNLRYFGKALNNLGEK